MVTGSVIGMIRKRWAAERPFEGSTSESLRNKLDCPATTNTTKAAVQAELMRRVDYGSPQVFEPRRG